MKYLAKYKINKALFRLVFILTFLSTGLTTTAQIAVIVNSNNPVENLSINELKAIFLGKQVYFKNTNTPILLCEYKPNLDVFSEKVYGFSGKTMNRHWFQLIFSGNVVNAPKKITTIENLLAFISGNERTIGYVDYRDLPKNIPGCKVVTIEGVMPAASGYLLSGNYLSNNEVLNANRVNSK